MRVHRKLLWALSLLVPIHIAVLFAGFVAPYGFGTQDRLHPYAPPSRMQVFDCGFLSMAMDMTCWACSTATFICSELMLPPGLTCWEATPSAAISLRACSMEGRCHCSPD